MTTLDAGLRFDVNLSILFTEVDLLRRPGAAAACGFDAVELWWPFAAAVPADPEVDALVEALGEAGVDLVALNLFAGDMAAGDRGVISLPGRAGELEESLAVLVGIASRTGCRRFNALYGARLPGVDPVAQDEEAVANLAMAARAVAGLGGTILVEPLTAGENGSYPLLTAADALRVVERARVEGGAANVAMLADLYHLARNGEDLGVVIAAHAGDFGHVQVADVPGRHQPGTGDLDVAGLLGQLAGAGYGGYVGLEYRPEGPSEESFAWLPRPLRHARARAEEAR